MLQVLLLQHLTAPRVGLSGVCQELACRLSCNMDMIIRRAERDAATGSLQRVLFSRTLGVLNDRWRWSRLIFQVLSLRTSQSDIPGPPTNQKCKASNSRESR
ncbi:hypothetical protein BaRGS_00011834, partial [Batillaria attramentaria]